MKKILLLFAILFTFNANSQTYYSQNFNTGGLNSWTTADLNNDGLQWSVLNASSVDPSFSTRDASVSTSFTVRFLLAIAS